MTHSSESKTDISNEMAFATTNPIPILIVLSQSINQSTNQLIIILKSSQKKTDTFSSGKLTTSSPTYQIRPRGTRGRLNAA